MEQGEQPGEGQGGGAGGAGQASGRSSRRIEHVIDDLSAIIERERSRGCRRAYFPALYRATTAEVLRAVEAGEFEDAERMVRMDVIFAGLYLRADREHEAGRPCSGPWRLAFEAASDDGLLVLQHLLLGMNAHINLDLPIAAVAAGGDQLAALRRDYDHLNVILTRMIDRMQAAVNAVSPELAWLDRLGGGLDELLGSVGIRSFRDEAWARAEALRAADAPGPARAALEERATRFGQRVLAAEAWLGWVREDEPDHDPAGVERVVVALTSAIPVEGAGPTRG
ncbi:MAG: hypothetical protein JNM72_06885 [Deltaproteobacteria bacterium]|nr:hypothetical protein [Deltaproteobacteria bacterium]